MDKRYAYKYAIIRLKDGRCMGGQDTSDYILDPTYVPVDDESRYVLKYYWPIPETVTNFNDFQGSWWNNAAHTDPFIVE